MNAMRASLLSAAAVACGCVDDLDLAGKACDPNHACISGFTCVDSACVVVSLNGEGEGEGTAAEGEGEGTAAEGEGEGTAGEGEGSEGEGEGAAGEGEGEGEGSAGEGEGAVGEGEGEGVAGEGEGEGAACTPVGHDEDHDGVDDACDNCPTVANAAQADVGEVNAGATADGVGDACDPRPTVGGDRIVAFDGFAGATLGAAWVGTSGWTVQNGQAVHASTSSTDILRRTDIADARIVVEIRQHITADNGSVGNSGIVLGMPSAADGLNCSTEHNTASSGNALRLVSLVNNAATTVFDTTAIANPIGRDVVLTMSVDTDVTCAIAGEASLAPGVTPPAAGGVGIRARTANVSLDSIVVYALGP